MHIPYNVGSGRLYSSEEEEQTQRESNTQVEVDKVVKSFDQVFSVEMFATARFMLKTNSTVLCMYVYNLHCIQAHLNVRKNIMEASKHSNEMLQPMYVM